MPSTPINKGSTVERIRLAAIDLFHQNGYAATSLRQVADEVGLQVGSLYNHINSKEELLYGIMRGIMEDLLEETRQEMEAAGGDPMTQVMAFMRCSIRFHGERKRETFIGNTELRGLSPRRRREIVRLRDAYQELLWEALKRAETTGEMELSDPWLATYAALAICTNVATWYQPDGRLTLDQIEELLPKFFAPLASFERLSS